MYKKYTPGAKGVYIATCNAYKFNRSFHLLNAVCRNCVAVV